MILFPLHDINENTKENINMKPILTIEKLKYEAKEFCEDQSLINHFSLYGVTDGKAVGTYVEHLFQNELMEKYQITIGSSAKGIDFPEDFINTFSFITKKIQMDSPD